MKFASMMAALAVAGTVVAPVAAQAGTKASAAVVAPADYGSRDSTKVDSKHELRRKSLLLGVAAVGVAGLGIYFATRSRSRG